MRMFLSYAKSHIYEIHSVLAATITFLVMFVVKKPIKYYLSALVDRKAIQNPKWQEHKALYKKRYNMIIILITVLFAFGIFGVISFISPLIHFSLFSATLSGILALTEYAIYDQFMIRRRKNE